MHVPSILFVLAGIIVAYLHTNATRYYAKEDVYEDEESKEKALRTAVRGISPNVCDEEKLNNYFREAYPSMEILLYISELNLRVWQQSKKMFEETRQRPVVYNNKCRQMCGVKDQSTHVRDEKCGIAFVIFSTLEQAHKAYADFRSTCFSRHRRIETSRSKTLVMHEWNVKFTPSPKNSI
ncbi:unnamed protein product [Adineta steineri]|uniref:Uncharacterized protein n=1 Tax=Adineta steineri TaxID=433720 RepID=A0A819T688_9BILA|nr:unnamed protein product [Adineta steineri]